jgi:predicted nucleic acid-binding protein
VICVDTTFLVHLWRGKDAATSPAVRLLHEHQAEEFAVPSHAAGEFLEGGASISSARLEESLLFLRAFRVGDVTVETALHYARITANLRRDGTLGGRSKPDLWIAAWAVQHGSKLVTTNVKHFGGIAGLSLITY